MTYGTGNVQGDIITDNIVVAGLALNNHTFGVANQESVQFSADSVPFDGLMGLAQSVRITFISDNSVDADCISYRPSPNSRLSLQ